MAPELKPTRDPVLIFASSMMLVGASQAFEMLTADIGMLLRGISLALAFFTFTWGVYVYHQGRDQ